LHNQAGGESVLDFYSEIEPSKCTSQKQAGNKKAALEDAISLEDA
jgi:hypothetical protein